MRTHTYRLSAPPPSDNRLKAAVNGRMISTSFYREWKEAVGWEIQAQRGRQVEIVNYPVTVRVSVKDDSWAAHRRDIGNVVKAVCDLLVSQGVLKDDNVNYVSETRAIYGHGAPSYVITIEEPE